MVHCCVIGCNSRSERKLRNITFHSPYYSVLNKLPTSRACCFCISPKVGSLIIAIFGLFLSLVYVTFYEFGEAFLKKLHVNETFSQIVIHVYAVMGILLFAVQILLLIATITYNEVLILLYLWYVIAFSFIDVILISYMAISLIINNSITLGVIMIACDMLFWILIYIFVVPAINGFRMNIHTIRVVIR